MAKPTGKTSAKKSPCDRCGAKVLPASLRRHRLTEKCFTGHEARKGPTGRPKPKAESKGKKSPTKPKPGEVATESTKSPDPGDPGIRDRVVELRRVRAGDLEPHPENWRLHPEGQRTAVSAALQELGYADALLARELPGGQLQLIDGHLRAELTPDQEVPVLILDLDEAEARKLLAVFDPLTDLAETDLPTLTALLDLVEFEMPELSEIALDVLEAATPVRQAEQDEVPELQETAITRVGDLWLLGPHRLLCGDSTDAKAVARLVGEHQPFQMVTDPPYGVEYDPKWRNDASMAGRGKGAPGSRATGKVKNDDRVDWTEAWKLFDGDVAYVWHGSKTCSEVLLNLEAVKFQIRAQLIWKKSRKVISRGAYHWQHEPCWYAVRKGKSARWAGDRKQSTIWDIDTNQANETGHGTQKPVECMARPMRNHGKRGDVVYDPFLGSGTSIVAAEQVDRVCVGLELDPLYVDVIVRRWLAGEGRTALLDSDGRTFEEIEEERGE